MEHKPRYTIEVVDNIPNKAPEDTRESMAQMVLQKLHDAPTGLIKLTTEDGEPHLDRLYKTMIQWRARHKNAGIGIKKQGQTVYFWRVDREEAARSEPDSTEEQGPDATGSTALF